MIYDDGQLVLTGWTGDQSSKGPLIETDVAWYGTGFCGVEMMRCSALVCLIIAAATGGFATPEKARVLQFQPDWFPNGQFAGFFMAEAEGLYAREGLEIDFDVFAYGKNSVAEVVEGRAAFGTMDSYIFMQKVAAGAPIVAVGAVLNTSPAGFIYLESTGIESFRDLQGRKLGVHAFADDLARYFARVAELPEDAVVYQRVHHDISVLLKGEVDAHQGYAVDELLRLRGLSDQSSDILLFEDLGLPMYSMIIYTTIERLQEEPVLVERFVRASEQGYRAALADPLAAAAKIAEDHAHPEVDESMIPLQIEALAPFLAFEQRQGRFSMTLERWQQMQMVFLEGGLIEEPIDLAKHVYFGPED